MKNSYTPVPIFTLIRAAVLLMFVLFFAFFINSGCGPAPGPEPDKKADFSVNTTSPALGQEIMFVDASTNSPTSRKWTFDGGEPNTSTEKNPKVRYFKSGNYTVTLSTTNADGDTVTESKINYITVAKCGTLYDIDGNKYKLVEVGGVCWMAENLRTTKYNDGTPIKKALTESEFVGASEGLYFNYFNVPNYDSAFGNFYSVQALISAKNICPQGWHISTQEDWNEMFSALGGEFDAVPKILTKTTGFPGTNSSGLNFLRNGQLQYGVFAGDGDGTLFGFSSNFLSDFMDNDYHYYNLDHQNGFAYRFPTYYTENNNERSMAVGCRCVSNE